MPASISHDSGRLKLDPDGTGTAAAEQQVPVAAADRTKRHHLAFEIVGAPGDAVYLTLGTAAGGTDIGVGIYKTGHHLREFVPGAANVYIRFAKAGGAPVWLDRVRILDDEALEITTPWPEGQLPSIGYDQSGEVMTLTDGVVAARDLILSGETNYTLQEFPNMDGPYLPENLDDDLELYPAAKTGADVTITASRDLFVATDLYRHITIRHVDADDNIIWGWGIIRSVTNAREVQLEVRRAFGRSGAGQKTPAWRLGAWNRRIGYPAATVIHDGRQHFAGGSGDLSHRIDGSAQPGFTRFTPGAGNAADAWTRDLGVRGMVRHLVSASQLIALSSDEERALSGDGVSTPITPGLFSNKSVGLSGSSLVRPIALGGVVLMVDRTGRVLYEVNWEELSRTYEKPDLSLLAQHITRPQSDRGAGGLLDMAFIERPWVTVLTVRADGVMPALVYLRAERILGWSGYVIERGVVESVATTPGVNDDDIWLVVRYGIRRRIERLASPLQRWERPDAGFYVDSGKTIDNRIAETLTPSATAGELVSFVAGGDAFTEASVGKHIVYTYRAADGAHGETVYKTARATIVNYISGTVVRARIDAEFPSTDSIPAGDWGVTVDRVSGLDHLEGEECAIYGDGLKQAARTVENGAVTVDPPAVVVHVGHDYTWRWRTLPLEVSGRQGASAGRPTNVRRVISRLVRTARFSAGFAGKRLYPQRAGETDLHTGNLELDVGGGWQRQASLIVEGNDGPAEIVLLIPHTTVGEAQ